MKDTCAILILVARTGVINLHVVLSRLGHDLFIAVQLLSCPIK